MHHFAHYYGIYDGDTYESWSVALVQVLSWFQRRWLSFWRGCQLTWRLLVLFGRFPVILFPSRSHKFADFMKDCPGRGKTVHFISQLLRPNIIRLLLLPSGEYSLPEFRLQTIVCLQLCLWWSSPSGSRPASRSRMGHCWGWPRSTGSSPPWSRTTGPRSRASPGPGDDPHGFGLE